MNNRNMIYTRQARWFVDVHAAVGRGGRLRCAVLILTPYNNHFVEFTNYVSPAERVAAAARLTLTLLSREPWFRRPRTIRTGSKAVTAALKELEADVPVRTDSRSSRLRLAREAFEAHAAKMPRQRAWLVSARMVA